MAKSIKWLFIGGAGVILVFFISIVVLLGPKNSADATAQLIAIPAGESRSAVAGQLVDAGLIKSQFAFFLFSRVIGGKILPGTYELSPSQSGSVIAGILRDGKIKTAKIVLIEGWRATDIEDYLVNEKRLKQFVGFSAAAEADEGYLFPDTYEIKFDETIPGLIKLLKDNFNERTKSLSISRDQLILASIVEREAKADEERSQIAGVYNNRIIKGMRLQADPTIQYAKGNWKAVTLADYQLVDSPYNTYLHDGLPPGPICNPGLKSIIAALNPTKSDYFYFFHAKGQIYLSKTYEEHASKVRQYFN